MIAVQHETILEAPYYEPIPIDFKLYLVTDRHQTAEKRTLLEVANDALRGGVKAIQLREKDLNTRKFLTLAYEMRALTLKYDARLFINDRVDIAIAVDADGVHLTQTSIPPFAVRKLAARMIIGVSTHNRVEAIKAYHDGADFITLGPIYPTPSKAKYGKAIGLKAFEEITHAIEIPVFGIGGIKLDNVKDVVERGAEGIALISGIIGAINVKPITMKYMRQLR